jgi:hypothetical protein
MRFDQAQDKIGVLGHRGNMKRIVSLLLFMALALSGCYVPRDVAAQSEEEPKTSLEVYSFLEATPEEFAEKAKEVCQLIPPVTGKPNTKTASMLRVQIAKRADLVIREMQESSAFDASGYTRTEIETVLVYARSTLENQIASECGFEQFLTEADKSAAEPKTSPAPASPTEPEPEPEVSERPLSSAPDALLKDCLRYSIEYVQAYEKGFPDTFVAREWFGHTKTVLITGVLEPVYRSKAMGAFWDGLVLQEGPNGVSDPTNLLVQVQAFCLVTAGIDILN